MNEKFYTFTRLRVLLLLLLFGGWCKVEAQTLSLSKSVQNISTSGNGATAGEGRKR